MERYEAESLPGEQLVLVITSTFGNGGPPANASALLAHLHTGPRLPGVRFGVCGLGDRTYPQFAQCGRDFDRLLAEAGAERVVPLVLCDVDFEDDFPAFEASVLGWLTTSGGAFREAAAPNSSARSSLAVPAQEADRERTFVATLRQKRRLSGARSNKETMHYELSLDGAAVSVEPGDSFAVYPVNDPAEVSRILECLDLSGDLPLTIGGEPTTLGAALLTRCDLQQVTEGLLDALLQVQGPAATAREAGPGAYADWRAGRYVGEALVEHPGVRLDAQVLVDSLRQLKPRLYSVANSPLLYPDSLHFTVETLRWTHDGFDRAGVASTWLCDRIDEGGRVRLHRIAGEHFRLPTDGDADVVCVGPGTGVAPFRAFLQHRAARGDRGRTWLFFGHQTEAEDALYADEFLDLVERGVLTRYTCAWSRDQPQRIYVQDRMREHAAELWSWLTTGAVLYVCGDKLRMAGDVRACLVDLARAQGGLEAAAAEAWVAQLEADGRYRLDVY